MVGLGVAGMKTLIVVASVRRCTSPSVSPVTKPTAQEPFRGYSTNTTRRNAFVSCLNIVSRICLMEL